MIPAFAVLSALPDRFEFALIGLILLNLGFVLWFEGLHQLNKWRYRKSRRPGNIMDAQGDARLPR